MCVRNREWRFRAPALSWLLLNRGIDLCLTAATTQKRDANHNITDKSEPAIVIATQNYQRRNISLFWHH